MTLYFHANRKGDAAAWTKKINKAGFEATFKAITDNEGRPGHGPGSMGYNVIVEADYKDRDAIIDLDPRRQRFLAR